MSDSTGGRSFWSRILEPEMIIALSAMLVSVCALVASGAQIQIMREEQHATVWPRLYVAQSYTPGETLSLLVVNPGIGPGIVKHVSASVDGVPLTSWSSVASALAPDVAYRRVGLSTIATRVVTPGEVISTFQTSDPALADALMAEIDRLDVSVCYCSVYDSCWEVTDAFGRGVGSEPVEVSSCPPVGSSSFVD